MAKKLKFAGTTPAVDLATLKQQFAGTRADAKQGETSLNRNFVYIFLNTFTSVERVIRNAQTGDRNVKWAAGIYGRIGKASKAVSEATVSVNSLLNTFVVDGEKDAVNMVKNLADFVPDYMEISPIEVSEKLAQYAEKNNTYIKFVGDDSIVGRRPNQFDTIDRPRELFRIETATQEEIDALKTAGLIELSN